MKDIFIKVNHTPIRLRSIVGLRSPYYIEMEKEKKKEKKTLKATLGLPKSPGKTRVYCFDVITTNFTFAIVPSIKCYSPSSNTKGRCLVEYGRISNLLLDLKDEEENQGSSEGTLHKQI